jgi:hypothetical protein
VNKENRESSKEKREKMASGFSQVAIANHSSLSVPIQIGVSYTDNWWPRISVWVITQSDHNIRLENMAQFKKLKFDELELSNLTVSSEVLKQALELWSESESGKEDLLRDHPWVKAGMLLWKNDPRIGKNAWAAGC